MTKTTTVSDLQEFRGRDTIAVCESIIKRVRAGVCSGMVYALREDGKNHLVGATGEYKRNPQEVCIIAGNLTTHYSGEAGFFVKEE
jgi:hypothetical protein